jgi:serpin B
MQLTERMGYEKVPGATVIALGYRGLPFQFLAILPDDPSSQAGDLLTADLFARLAKIPSAKVRLQMPKFRIEPPTINLADVFADMGMPSAFDRPRGSANFDAIAPRRPDEYLFISGIFHKTFIELDEKGTEAAAATAVAMMRATSIDLEEPVEVKLDRPFFYAIQHQPTGAVFFLGQLKNPQ